MAIFVFSYCQSCSGSGPWSWWCQRFDGDHWGLSSTSDSSGTVRHCDCLCTTSIHPQSLSSLPDQLLISILAEWLSIAIVSLIPARHVLDWSIPCRLSLLRETRLDGFIECSSCWWRWRWLCCSPLSARMLIVLVLKAKRRWWIYLVYGEARSPCAWCFLVLDVSALVLENSACKLRCVLGNILLPPNMLPGIVNSPRSCISRESYLWWQFLEIWSF